MTDLPTGEPVCELIAGLEMSEAKTFYDPKQRKTIPVVSSEIRDAFKRYCESIRHERRQPDRNTFVAGYLAGKGAPSDVSAALIAEVRSLRSRIAELERLLEVCRDNPRAQDEERIGDLELKLANVADLPDKIRTLKDGKHLQDYAALLIEEAIDADVQNGFTREAREAVK